MPNDLVPEDLAEEASDADHRPVRTIGSRRLPGWAQGTWAQGTWVRAAAVLLVILVVAFAVWRLAGGGEYVAQTPSAPPTQIADTDKAVHALDTMAAEANGAGATPSGDGAAAMAVRNAHAIGISGVSAEYVADASAVNADGTWTGQIDVTWHIQGEPAVVSHVKTDFTRNGSITGFHADEGRLPLWLSAPVDVRRSATTLVVDQGGEAEADKYEKLAAAAVAGVRKVVPWAHPRLVLEIPSGGLDTALGASAGTYAEVAAVTATIDGSSNAKMPEHVWVNPDQIGNLDGPGAQVVLTHEATHAATGAAVNTKRPIWLSEGFADYVALHDSRIPVKSSAAQILKQVKKSGAPAHLPGKTEFDAHSEDFGAEYEAAWLACRLLGREGGDDAIVALYDDTGRGVPLDASLRSHFGFDEAGLTSRWRAELSELAR